MKPLLLGAFVLAAFSADAQRQAIGLKAGTGEMNIRSDLFRGRTDARHCLSLGLTYERFLTKHVTLGAELLFQQRGFSDDFIYTDILGRETGRVGTPYNYDYLALPLKIGFNRGNTFFGFGSVGLVPALVLQAEIIEPDLYVDGVRVYEGQTHILTKQADQLELGGIAEAGCGYRIRGRYQIYASASYQHGITSISNKSYFDGTQLRHYGYLFNIGFRYELGGRVKAAPAASPVAE